MDSPQRIKVFAEQSEQTAFAVAMLQASLGSSAVSAEFLDYTNALEGSDTLTVVDNFIQSGKNFNYSRVVLLGRVCDVFTLDCIEALPEHNIEAVVMEEDYCSYMTGYDWLQILRETKVGKRQVKVTYAMWAFMELFTDFSRTEETAPYFDIVEISVGLRAAEINTALACYNSSCVEGFVFSLCSNIRGGFPPFNIEDAKIAERVEQFAFNKKEALLRDSCIVNLPKYALFYTEGTDDAVLTQLINTCPEADVVICVSLMDRALAYCVRPGAPEKVKNAIKPEVELKIGNGVKYDLRVAKYDPTRPVVFWGENG